MISVILIDDHKLILEGISNMLKSESDIQILSTFSSAKEGLKTIKTATVDIVITDLDMPDMNGIQLIKAIRKLNPGQKIIVLSMIDEEAIINRMIKYDVNGYLMKNEAQGELVSAIRKVADGELYYNKEIRKKIFLTQNNLSTKSHSRIPRLTKREKEILSLVINEYTMKEIASQLYISEGTVITHRKHILAKLGAKNTAGMVRIAVELGLV